jgi:hydroxypyruvate isomerase
MFYSACASSLFGGQPIHETLPRIQAAGLSHYEFWGWEGQDIDALAAAQRRCRLELTALCTPILSLTDARQHSAFLDGLTQTIAVCKRLGCSTVIAQTGAELMELSRPAQHRNIVQGLRAAVPALAAAGITLVVEPLNTKIDHVGYYLWSSAEAFEIVDEVGSANVQVLFDLYHQYIMEGLSIPDIVRNLPKIGHFHMAGYPGRHEPLVNSEIDYRTLLKAIGDAGYPRGVGLEYFPAQAVDEGLKRLMEELKAL